MIKRSILLITIPQNCRLPVSIIIVNCKACHPTLVFNDAKTDCNECHTDIHQATVGQDCSRCHTTFSWLVANINEIHQHSRFPLLGAHRTADCSDCHHSESMVRFDVLGVNCIDCHREDYTATSNPNHTEAGFSEDCSSVIRLIHFSGQVRDLITISFRWCRAIPVVNVQSAILREHTLMQIRNVTPVISRIIRRRPILSIQPWDSLLHAICAIHLNPDGNRRHLPNTTISHFPYIPENIRAHGHPALNAIRILQIILNLHVSHAMSIIKPTWITSTGKKAAIPTTVQPAFTVIQGEWQMIKNNYEKNHCYILGLFCFDMNYTDNSQLKI